MKAKLSFGLVLLLLLVTACTTEPLRRDVDKKKSAEANAQLGLQYMAQGNFHRALEKLQRALDHDPDSANAHHYIAELYRRLEENEDADQHYRRAVRLDPENSALHNNFGVFLCSQGRYGESEKQFLKVLENPVYPERARTYENLGLCQEPGAATERAEAYFRKALALDARLLKSLYAMTELSFAQGNHLSARAYLQRYLEIGPHTPRSLWLGIRVERQLNDKNAVASYGMLLKGNFPESREAQRYLESE